MKRRVCDTCVFFERADIANSGWCNHPTRRASTDVRLIVRQNELACRNGWDSDLWVARGANDGGELRHRDAEIPFGNGKQPDSPLPDDELTHVVAARSPQVIGRRPIDEIPPEDVVVHQSPVARVSHPDEPATKLVQDPKAAIQRAREQFRARRRDEGRLADRALGRSVIEPVSGTPLPIERPINPSGPNHRQPAAAQLASSSREYDDGGRYDEPPVEPVSTADDRARAASEPGPLDDGATVVSTVNEERPPARPRQVAVVAPVTRDELFRPFPAMTSFPEDDDRFETIPEPMNQFDMPVAADPEMPIEPLYAGDDYEDGEEWDDWIEEEAPVIEQRPRRRRRPSKLELFLAARRNGSKRNQPAQSQFDDGYLEDDSYYLDQEEEAYEPIGWERQDAFERIDSASQPADRDADPEPRDPVVEYDDWDEVVEELSSEPIRMELDVEIDEPEERVIAAAGGTAESEWPEWPKPARAEPERPTHRRQAAVEDHVEPPQFNILDDLFESSSSFAGDAQQSVPRTCRGCRDFRPAENGDRGWCNNNWAFHHRRMVDADDLPCETSFGSWWLPHDDTWLKKADISRHGEPTPSFDRWLTEGHSRHHDPRIPTSAGQRRRRQS